MDNFQFSPLPSNIHQCISRRDGDWIIWHCPLCANYERRFNYVTGEMMSRRGNSTAHHTGSSNNRAMTEVLANNLCAN